MNIPFKHWRKIHRLINEKYHFTEKLDGSNACIVITETGQIACQSRNKFVTPGKTSDNYGFAAWVEENKSLILPLGPGYYFGEWWGQGINRGYDLKERRFSLFFHKAPDTLPTIIDVVPSIPAQNAQEAIDYLNTYGSLAAPGYKQPEGVVMFAELTGSYYKILIDKTL